MHIIKDNHLLLNRHFHDPEEAFDFQFRGTKGDENLGITLAVGALTYGYVSRLLVEIL